MKRITWLSLGLLACTGSETEEPNFVVIEKPCTPEQAAPYASGIPYLGIHADPGESERTGPHRQGGEHGVHHAGGERMSYSGSETRAMQGLPEHMEFSRMGKGMPGGCGSTEGRCLSFVVRQPGLFYSMGGAVRKLNHRRASISPRTSARVAYPSISSGEVWRTSVASESSRI